MDLDLSFGLQVFDELLHDLLPHFSQGLIGKLFLFLIEPLHIGVLVGFECKDVGVVFLGINLIRQGLLCRQCQPPRFDFRKLSNFRKLNSTTKKPPSFLQF